MPVTVYVLKSKGRRWRYIGITNDLARRLREHSAGGTKASQIIGEFRLLYTEEFSDHSVMLPSCQHS